MTMQLTIELNTMDKLSERDQAILTAIAGAESVEKIAGDSQSIVDQSVIELDEAVKPVKLDTLFTKGTNPETGELNLSEEFVKQTDQAAGGGSTFDTSQASLDSQPEEIDAAGMPWDARINPKSRAKIKTGKRAGCWKYIKQLDTKQPGLIEQVEAENKARLIKQIHTEEPTEFEVGADGQAIAAQTFAAPCTAIETQTLDFATFMLNKITPRLEEKPDFANHVNAVLAAHQLKSLTELISKQNLIPQIDAELESLWATV